MVHALGLDHTPEPTEGGVLLTRGSDIEMRDPPLPTERVETTGRKARGRKPRAAQPPATPEPALLDTDQPEPVPEPAPPPPPAMISPAQISAAAEQFARLLRGARAAVSEMSTADRLSIASSIISALNFEYQDLFPSQPDPAPSPSASLAKRLGKTVPAEFADLRADLHRYVAESGRGVQTRIAKAVNISIGQLNNFLKERGSLGVSNATKLRQYLAGQP
jgi:hypothetical protein